MTSFGNYVKNTSQPMPLRANPADADSAQEKHRKAADVHERAFRHHREAARLHEKGDHRQADIHANIALGHAHAAAQIEALISKWEAPH